MKGLTILFILFLLAGCSEDIFNNTYAYPVSAEQFEGYYRCDNNSTLELISDFADRVSFETSGQSLNSLNPQNNTLGTHPVVSERDLLVYGNSLLIAPRNYNYNSSTHDIEEDGSGSNITGNRRTDISVTRTHDSSLEVTFSIYQNSVNNNINSIVAYRELTCKRIQ